MVDGLDQQQLIDWMLGEWAAHGPAVALIEGFSGIGKSEVARRVMKAWGARSLMVTAAEGGATFEDVLFDVAAGLENAGDKTVADYADGDFRAGLLQLLREGNLVVIDDFNELLDPATRQPTADIVDFCNNSRI